MQNENTAYAGIILAIEDDLQDVEILRLALAQRKFPRKVVSVQFARDAMLYLAGVGQYADRTQFPRPTLIVLDLALPGMSGIDFLTWARHETNIPPIVVLTYSKSEQNRMLAEKFGVKGYFVKSPDLKETAAMLETLLLLSTPPQIQSDQTGATINPEL